MHNPLTTPAGTTISAHGISVLTEKFCQGNRQNGVMPRYITTFQDADGNLYWHKGSPTYYDLEGKRVARRDAKLVCGAAALVDGAALDLVTNGWHGFGYDHPLAGEVAHVVTFRETKHGALVRGQATTTE